MIDAQTLNDSVWMSATFDLFRIVAANIYGGYDISDPVDAIAVNAEVIITIITEKCVSRSLAYFVPQFHPLQRIGNFRNGALFYLSAGVATSALVTTVIYPLQVFRARRKAQKSLRNSNNNENGVIIEEDANASPAPAREEKPTIIGGFLCFIVNTIPTTIDIGIDYAKGHTEKLAILAIASSFALANYAITGGYRKFVRKILPKSLP